jgi:hypothetical protein
VRDDGGRQRDPVARGHLAAAGLGTLREAAERSPTIELLGPPPFAAAQQEAATPTG